MAALSWISFALLAVLIHGNVPCPRLFNFYPDTHDCTKFYRCNWGKAVLFVCPAGTRWSQKLLTCDHARNVPCYKTPVHKVTHDPNYGYIKTPDAYAKTPDFTVDYDSKYNHKYDHDEHKHGYNPAYDHHHRYPTYQAAGDYKNVKSYSPYELYKPSYVVEKHSYPYASNQNDRYGLHSAPRVYYNYRVPSYQYYHSTRGQQSSSKVSQSGYSYRSTGRYHHAPRRNVHYYSSQSLPQMKIQPSRQESSLEKPMPILPNQQMRNEDEIMNEEMRNSVMDENVERQMPFAMMNIGTDEDREDDQPNPGQAMNEQPMQDQLSEDQPMCNCPPPYFQGQRFWCCSSY